MDRGSTLQGDVAVVTGGGRNIGRGIAERFAAEGASVAVVDVSEERAAETVDHITSAGNEATSVIADVTDEAHVQRMVGTVEEAYGPIDVLVNNAGVMESEDLLDLSLEEFDRVLAVNLRGTFLCTREVAKSMRASGGGRIVNVASTSAHRGRSDAVAYATSKSGILNFTRSAAKALADHDIRVNTLTPTRTGPRTFGPSEGVPTHQEHGNVETAEQATAIREQIPAGRFGTPADHASAALFLVSEESGFVTGTELVVDGGRSA